VPVTQMRASSHLLFGRPRCWPSNAQSCHPTPAPFLRNDRKVVLVRCAVDIVASTLNIEEFDRDHFSIEGDPTESSMVPTERGPLLA